MVCCSKLKLNLIVPFVTCSAIILIKNFGMKLEEYIKEQCLEVQIFFANERLVNEGFLKQGEDLYKIFYLNINDISNLSKPMHWKSFARNFKTINEQHSLLILSYLIEHLKLTDIFGNFVLREPISRNENIFWTIEVLRKFENYLDFEILYLNKSIPKTEAILKFLVEKTNKLRFSFFNESFPLKESHFDRFKQYIDPFSFLELPQQDKGLVIKYLMQYVDNSGYFIDNERGQRIHDREHSYLYSYYKGMLSKDEKIEIITRIVRNGRYGALTLLNDLSIEDCITEELRTHFDEIIKNRIRNREIVLYIDDFNTYNYTALLKHIFIWDENFVIENLDRVRFSSSKNLIDIPWTERLIIKYCSRMGSWEIEMCLNKLNIRINQHLIDQIHEKLDFISLSSNLNVEWTFELINKYIQKWYWDMLTKNASVPFECISRFTENYLTKNEVLYTPDSMPISFYLTPKLRNRITYVEFIKNISSFYVISNKEIEENESILDFNYLSKNENIEFTSELIQKYENRWDWAALSGNMSISSEILLEFIDHLVLDVFCSRHYISNELILNYGHKLSFLQLSENSNLKLSSEVIYEFKEKWNWKKLFLNPSINWLEQPHYIIEEGFNLILKKGYVPPELGNLTFLPWNISLFDCKLSIDNYILLLNNVISDVEGFIRYNFENIVTAFLENELKSNGKKSNYNVSFEFSKADSELKENLIVFMKSRLLNNSLNLFPDEASKDYFEKLGHFLNWEGYEDYRARCKYYYEANYISRNPEAELDLNLIKKYTSPWQAGLIDVQYSEAPSMNPGEWNFYLSNNKYITTDILDYLVELTKRENNFNIWQCLMKNGNFSWDYDILDKYKELIKPHKLADIIKRIDKGSDLYRTLYRSFIS